jgi:hypothetical protein
MTVGATPSDTQKIAAWVQSNGTSADDGNPCGYACHEEITLSIADMAAGLTNASAAGAMTRFQVVELALINDPSGAFNTFNPAYGEGLLPHVRDRFDKPGSNYDLSRFTFNFFGFNEDIATGTDASQLAVTGIADGQEAALAQAIQSGLTPGFNTYLNWTVLPKISMSSGIVGSGGDGTSAASPLKLVLLVTDGLTSDREFANGGGANQAAIIQQFNPNIPLYPTIRQKACIGHWDNVTVTIYTAPPGRASGIDECAADYVATVWPQPENPAFTLAPFSPAGGFTGYEDLGIEAPIDTYFTPDKQAQLTVPNSLGYCSRMTVSNNVVLAILETPYEPFYAQGAGWFPYESLVQPTLYPDGQNELARNRATSIALKKCASPGYYFQAKDASQIAVGMRGLFNKFVAEFVPPKS